MEWEEPEFTDNVGVTSVMASQLPGQRLGLGRQGPHISLTTFYFLVISSEVTHHFADFHLVLVQLTSSLPNYADIHVNLIVLAVIGHLLC